MTDPSILRQRERERRECVARAEERNRLERERLDWAELSARADRQRAHNMLMAYRQSTYGEQVKRLFALDALINKI
jgi:hypothetical protein